MQDYSELYTESDIMIEHKGIVASVAGNKLSVKILQQSACSNCHAKNSCMAADSKEKMVDIFDFSGKYGVNDLVTIQGKESMGYKAILWAFLIPVALLVAILVLSTSVWNFGEMKAAMAAILSLVPYYAMLYLLRNKMAQTFRFRIKNKN